MSRHPGRPFILGLTGSIGMGKSTVARMFGELGVPVFDADAVVHHMQGEGGLLVDAIESAFPGTTGPGGVDRAKLGKHVFGNPKELRRLEQLIHPAVAAEREVFLIEHGGQGLVVFDIPLLFEKNLADLVDAVLVVSARPEIQRARVLARPGMSPERFAAILEHQVPDAEKQARADHVIDTGTTLAQTRNSVAQLIEKLAI